jgi:hypothetical protein
VFVVRDDTETLCCTVCGKPFTALERSWLASPAAGGTVVFQRDATLTNVAGELYGQSVAVLSRAGGAPNMATTFLTPVRSEADLMQRHEHQAAHTI